MQIVKNESEEMAITIPMDKFPRLQSLQKIVADLHNLVEYFNKRKSLIKNNIEEITPYQNNENKILVIQTDIELEPIAAVVVVAAWLELFYALDHRFVILGLETFWLLIIEIENLVLEIRNQILF